MVSGSDVRPRRADTGQNTASPAVAPIVIEQLTKNFGAVRAVSGLTFTVQPGRITGFLGPNGAGKSTTLRILVGLASPTSGSATFGGIRYADLDQPQQRVGAVLEPAFHPGRSGRNHLKVLAITARVGDDRIEHMLDLVGLTEAADRRVGGYSLGMRQRLALAGALLGDPDYLILDEPANGLDPEGIRWLRGFLRNFAGQGRVVLMSSHILNEVEATVDDVVVIGNGRLVRQAPMSELAASTSARVRVADPAAGGAVLDQLGAPWQLLQDHRGSYLVVAGIDLPTLGQRLFDAGIPVLELATQEVDLESEFFAMLAAQDGTAVIGGRS
jgi:ABC-2 type transport system ATP-binding protein